MSSDPGLHSVSLFGGVGGIDRAGEMVGIKSKLICEIDKPCRTVLAHRFPDAVLHDDVRTLTADDLRNAGAVPDRTVAFAGFPCTDLSVAGRRKGMGAGTQSGLFWEVDRLLAEFRPAWVVLENVAGLLSATCACPGDRTCGPDCVGELHQVKGGACGGQCIARHGGVMGAVLGSLAQLGYGFAYRVLDARFFGVPQRRRRVVVVGRLGDSGAAPAQVLLEPEGVLGDSAASYEAGSIIAAGVGAGAAVSGYDVYNDALTGDISPTITRPSGGANRIPHVVGVLGHHAHTLTAEGSDASEDGTGRRTPVIAFGHTNGLDIQASESVTPTLRAGHDAIRSVVTALTTKAGATFDDQQIGQLVHYVADQVSALDTAQGGPDDSTAQAGQLIAYPLAVRGREGGAELDVGSPGDPMFALRAGDGGSSRQQLVAAHENQRGELTLTDHAAALATPGGKPGQGYGVVVRRLTPLECERLQGFPDGWTDVQGSSDSQRYKQMGNSVAVPVFEWVLRRLIVEHASQERVA